jgi:D-alanyl-D-alanine carboxypeptidase
MAGRAILPQNFRPASMQKFLFTLQKIFLAGLFLAVAHSSAWAQRGNPDVTYAGQSIDQMISAFMAEQGVSGMAVAIVQAPYITRVTGYGLSDVASRRLSASNTMFDIGQMANAYLAVAVLQLVEGGKLGLDDAVSRFVPGAPAGLTVGQAIRGGKQTSQWLAPVVAKASGQSAEDHIRVNQIERLGLQHTSFGSALPSLAWEKNARPHSAFLKIPLLINPSEPATGYAGGNAVAVAVPAGLRIYASALDVSLWDIALAGEILITSPALRKWIYAAPEGAVSSGPWYFPGHKGLMVTTGDSAGFSSLLSRFTDASELVCVTLLANKEGVDLTQLARRIAGAYDARLGPPLATAKLRVQQSPFTVKETMDRLEKTLRERGNTVIARVDHARAAQDAKLQLAPTEEIIFGNPAAGTLLMQANPATVTALPLRAAAWEKDGAVWLTAVDPVAIAAEHGIKDQGALALQMRAAIDAALREAVAAP